MITKNILFGAAIVLTFASSSTDLYASDAGAGTAGAGAAGAGTAGN